MNTSLYLAVMALSCLLRFQAANAQSRFLDACATTNFRVINKRRFVGGDVLKAQRIAKTDGTLMCNTLCRDNIDCWSWNYDKNRKMCYLMSSEKSELSSQSSGAWASGYRQCDSYGGGDGGGDGGWDNTPSTTPGGNTPTPTPTPKPACITSTAVGNVMKKDPTFFENTVNKTTKFPPGKYAIKYFDGCMKYGDGERPFAVNENLLYSGMNQVLWYISTEKDEKASPAPGAYVCFNYTAAQQNPGVNCGFMSYDACVAYSKTTPPVTITLTEESRIGVWLQEVYFPDNSMGAAAPTWQLSSC